MDYQKEWKSAQNQEFGSEIIKEINILRKNPRIYLELLESYMERFEDNCLFFGGQEIGTIMDEGKSVVSTYF